MTRQHGNPESEMNSCIIQPRRNKGIWGHFLSLPEGVKCYKQNLLVQLILHGLSRQKNGGLKSHLPIPIQLVAELNITH